ncbi:MAG: MraY family glycosyltransferase [Mucilaginibacter sp.]
MSEFLNTHYYVYYVFIICFSAFITYIIIPSILHVARARHLYDDLGHFRKQHDQGIPRLGGVAIFVSFNLTILVCSVINQSVPTSYLLIASIILFATGLKDDLSGVNSSTKFLIQFIISLILVIMGDIRLTSMYGIFGVFELPYIASIIISILVIMLLINAFNLIDGIDGLAALTGITVNVTFAISFIYIKEYELAMVALAITGAILGFLKYNITPAKIFMGDTGSLLIGLISAVLALKFIELNKVGNNRFPEIYSAPAVAVAILIGPIFDTLRVFFIRAINGIPPFTADRNHIHHRLLKLGLTHLQATLILGGFNILAVITVLSFNSYGNYVLIMFIFGVCLLANWGLTFTLRSKERHSLALRNLFV